MSKKNRFNTQKKSTSIPPGALGKGGLKPQTMITISEGDDVKRYKSFNSRASAIQKLAKTSALPSKDIYDLSKTGELERDGLRIVVEAFDQETWDKLEKEQSHGK